MTYLPSFRIDGRVAIVTGASRGLGEHIALALAEAGAHVAAVGRDADRLQAVAEASSPLDGSVTPFAADVLQTSALSDLVSEVEVALGPVEILVNSAGTNIQQPATDVTEASWDAVLDLNLRSSFFMAQAAARRMIELGRPGRIVNLSSQIGEVGFYKRAVYAASKGGLVAMTRVLALEWAPHSIRVNSVGPTFIDSPLAREMFQDPQIADEVMRRIPIGRLGRTEEVAAAVLYLVSDGADLVTGHHLLVDGGWTAQ
ncbi:NAD(P)-dependent dehydrogenase (short-subunit alcohol dehydrogenase family) [Georgenia soli]|uniref:NAD(P)-dependent dehydrogenase (Short-subunit alcohol dehydrogenase family) n=1 Tax=Georgenia soli TaxID=638953 RepID=A0A2A9F2P6_9MICO|nr:glucose 1-dehydrogenase [Georgenia soli]PFG45086.1 NAD(P)-dependent dehydrogenase (short-subunit alcohol dehydrogenase family) [Georgenia soli]